MRDTIRKKKEGQNRGQYGRKRRFQIKKVWRFKLKKKNKDLVQNGKEKFKIKLILIVLLFF